jgi:hypothetical protein
MKGRSILLGCVAAIVGVAQVNTGALIGTITDASGAVVSGAAIEIRSLDTGSVESRLSNSDGIYRSPFLRPGSYSVRVEAKGFRASETRQIAILIGKETTFNVSLEVGLVSESVTVDGAAPLVEATTGQASVNFDSNKIISLPRLVAGIDRLALLAPGVAPAQATTTTNGATPAVNGQRRRANDFLIDGQDNNHPGFAGPSFPFNNVDVVAEYQIITNQFSAEYGKSQGGTVNITTKSGTNRLTGTASWLNQNDAVFTALTNLQRRSGLQQPPKAIDNLFGTTLGGPIRKDKAFFFAYFNREILRRDTRLEATSAQWTPTNAGLRSLEEAFPTSNPVKVLRAVGPLARSEGNPQFLPGFRVDTIRGAGGQTVGVEMDRLVRTLLRPVDAWDFGTREDFALSPKDRLSARFYYRDRFGAKDIASQPNGYSTDFYTEYHNAGVTCTRSIDPGTANELRFGYGRERDVWSGTDGTPFSEIGRNIANFTILSGGYLSFGAPVSYPQDAWSRSLEFQDNLTKQAGRHGLKLGVQYTRIKGVIGNRRLYNGQFQFNSLQDFVDNRPAFNASAGDLVANITAKLCAGYFQDDFRFRQNLTLNLGIRYESATQPASSLHDFTVQRESNAATAMWAPALPLGARTVPLPPPDRNNWAPRIGFAYTPRFAQRLFGKEATVLRGGYSIGYEFPYLFQAISVFSSAPVGNRYTLTNFSVPEDVTGDNLRKLTSPPRGGDPRQQNQFQFAPDFHSPYAQTWSLGVQRRVGLSRAFEVRYAGSRGSSLLQTRNGNPNAQAFVTAGFPQVLPTVVQPGFNSACAPCSGRVDPSFSQIALLANTAASTYHALQTRYDGRFGGLVFGASYTWSRAIDNASDLLATSPGAPMVQFMAQNPFDLTRGERGPSDFDLTHVATLHFVWDVPWFKAHSGMMGVLFGAWTLSGMQRWNTGRPVSAYQQNSGTPTVNDRDFNSNFIMSSDTTRAFSANPGAPAASLGFVLVDGSVVDHFNRTRAVTLNDVRWIYNNLAAARLFGTPFGSGRNVLRAPGFNQADLALYKNFKVRERVTVQLRFESTNSFNHPNLGPGGSYVDQPGFFNPGETETEPRRFGVGLRILF